MKFLIDFDFYRLIIVDNCIQYLHVIQLLTIKYNVSRSKKLIIEIN